jgi:hypothetical protein
MEKQDAEQKPDKLGCKTTHNVPRRSPGRADASLPRPL